MWKATCIVIAMFFVLALTQAHGHEGHQHTSQMSLARLDDAGQNRLRDIPDLPSDHFQRKHKHPKRHAHYKEASLPSHKGLVVEENKHGHHTDHHHASVNQKHAHKRHATYNEHEHEHHPRQHERERQVVKPHKKQGKSKAHAQPKHQSKHLHKSGATQHGKKQHDQRWKQ